MLFNQINNSSKLKPKLRLPTTTLTLLFLVGVGFLIFGTQAGAHNNTDHGGRFVIDQTTAGSTVRGQITAPDNHRVYTSDSDEAKSKSLTINWRLLYVDDRLADCESAYSGGSSQDSDFNTAFSAATDKTGKYTFQPQRLDDTEQKTARTGNTHDAVTINPDLPTTIPLKGREVLHGKYICVEAQFYDTSSSTLVVYYEYLASETAIDYVFPRVVDGGVSIVNEKDYTADNIGEVIEITVTWDEDVYVRTSDPAKATLWPRLETNIPNWGGNNDQGESYLELVGDRTRAVAVGPTRSLTFRHTVGYDTRQFASDPSNAPNTFDDTDGSFDFSVDNIVGIKLGDYGISDTSKNSHVQYYYIEDNHKTDFSINIDTKVLVDVTKGDSGVLNAEITPATYARTSSDTLSTVDAQLAGSGYAWYKSVTEPTDCATLIGDPTQTNNQGEASTILEAGDSPTDGSSFTLPDDYNDHYYCAAVVEANAYKAAPPDATGNRNVNALRISYSDNFYHHTAPPIPPVDDPPVQDPPVDNPPVNNPPSNTNPGNNNPPSNTNPGNNNPPQQPTQTIINNKGGGSNTKPPTPTKTNPDPNDDNPPADTTPPRISSGTTTNNIYQIEVSDVSGLAGLAYTHLSRNQTCRSSLTFDQIVTGSTINIDLDVYSNLNICIRAIDRPGNTAIAHRRARFNPPTPTNDQPPDDQPPPDTSQSTNPQTSDSTTPLVQPSTPTPKQPQTLSNNPLTEDNPTDSDSSTGIKAVETEKNNPQQTSPNSEDEEEQPTTKSVSESEIDSGPNNNQTLDNNNDDSQNDNNQDSSLRFVAGGLIGIVIVTALIVIIRFRKSRPQK